MDMQVWVVQTLLSSSVLLLSKLWSSCQVLGRPSCRRHRFGSSTAQCARLWWVTRSLTGWYVQESSEEAWMPVRYKLIPQWIHKDVGQTNKLAPMAQSSVQVSATRKIFILYNINHIFRDIVLIPLGKIAFWPIQSFTQCSQLEQSAALRMVGGKPGTPQS